MSNAVFPSAIRGLAFTVTKTAEFNTAVQSSPNKYETRIGQTSNPIWTIELIYEVLKDFRAYDYAIGLQYSDYQTLLGFWLARQGQYDDFLFTDPDDNSVGPATITFAASPWLAFYPFVLGAIIIDGAGGHAQQVSANPPSGFTGAARSGQTAPTWNHAGGTTTDGQLTWQDLGAIPTAGWPNPFATLQVFNDGAGHYYSPIQRNVGGQFYEDVTDLNGGIAVYANGVLKANPADYSIVGPGLAIPGNSWMGLVVKWVGTPTSPVTAAFNFYYRMHFKSDSQDFEKFMNFLWTIGGEGGRNGKGYLELVSSRIGLT